MKKLLFFSLLLLLSGFSFAQNFSTKQDNSFDGRLPFTILMEQNRTRTASLEAYKQDFNFYAAPGGTGPSFTFKVPGYTLNDFGNYKTDIKNRFYVVVTDGAEARGGDRAEQQFIPSATMMGSSITVEQWAEGWWQTGWGGGNYNSPTAKYNSFQVVVEVPEWKPEIDDKRTLCKDQELLLSDYFTGAPNIKFYVDGIERTSLKGSEVSLGAHSIVAKKFYNNGDYVSTAKKVCG